jgi:hypothetical protein
MRTVFRWNPETEKLEEIYNSESRFSDSPAVIFDDMAPTEHPATGRIFTSKRAFHAETIASGCVPIHGNDRPVKHWESEAAKEEKAHKQFDEAFERAYYDVRDKRIPEFRMNPEAQAAWRRANGHRDD